MPDNKSEVARPCRFSAMPAGSEMNCLESRRQHLGFIRSYPKPVLRWRQYVRTLGLGDQWAFAAINQLSPCAMSKHPSGKIVFVRRKTPPVAGNHRIEVELPGLTGFKAFLFLTSRESENFGARIRKVWRIIWRRDEVPPKDGLPKLCPLLRNGSVLRG
jgi:hypothetical protein